MVSPHFRALALRRSFVFSETDKIEMTMLRVLLTVVIGGGIVLADIPAGAGKDATVKYCSDCHSIEQAVSLRQGAEEWKATLEKMTGMGAKIPDSSYESILGYLTSHFGADAPLPI